MVSDAGGVLLVPSFAIGRTQEIVYALDRLLEAGKIPELPLYLDSPMASKASDIYRRHAEYFDEETRRAAPERRHAARLPEPDRDPRRRTTPRRSPSAQRPYMIVASNGMLTGGRVLGHLRNLIGDPTATLLFVGYQGEGTLGAHLQAGAKTVKLDGQVARGALPDPLDQRLLAPTPTRPSCSTGCGHFADGRGAGRPPASRGRCSSSTATPRPRS